MSRPLRTSSSSCWSNLPLSLVSVSMIGSRSSRPCGHTAAAKSGSRARIHSSLPWSVLISPLWQIRLKGCAFSQEGSVFVL